MDVVSDAHLDGMTEESVDMNDDHFHDPMTPPTTTISITNVDEDTLDQCAKEYSDRIGTPQFSLKYDPITSRPIRPPNCFLLFMKQEKQGYMEYLRAQGITCTQGDVNKSFGKMWDQLPIDKKAPFQEMFKELQTEWLLKKAEYEKLNGPIRNRKKQRGFPFVSGKISEEFLANAAAAGVFPPKQLGSVPYTSLVYSDGYVDDEDEVIQKQQIEKKRRKKREMSKKNGMAYNAFIHFSNEKRDEVTKVLNQDPQMAGKVSAPVVQSALATQWEQLTQEQKQVYVNRYNEQKFQKIHQRAQEQMKKAREQQELEYQNQFSKLTQDPSALTSHDQQNIPEDNRQEKKPKDTNDTTTTHRRRRKKPSSSDASESKHSSSKTQRSEGQRKRSKKSSSQKSDSTSNTTEEKHPLPTPIKSDLQEVAGCSLDEILGTIAPAPDGQEENSATTKHKNSLSSSDSSSDSE